MITVERITTAEQVVNRWIIFREGLETIIDSTREQITDAEYLKLVLSLCGRDDAWIGVAVQSNTDGPLSYGIAVDSTLPGSERKTFTVLSFYAMKGRPDATEVVMAAFEEWARTNGVKSYVITTRRDSGAGLRCINSPRYGFRKAFIAMEKNL
jgi:hypothetical protein